MEFSLVTCDPCEAVLGTNAEKKITGGLHIQKTLNISWPLTRWRDLCIVSLCA